MSRRRLNPAILAALIAVISHASAPAKPERPPPGWQALITPADRVRIHLWRNAWIDGLNQARADGFADRIAAGGVLFEPDAALADVALPDGAYRCTVYRLGARSPGGGAFQAMPPQPCRIGANRFAIVAGMQRPAGRLWPFDQARRMFLGAMALGDEGHALEYGRDGERDMVGVVERIGDRRWRLVLPRPHWQSQIDVVEIVPAES